MSTRSCYRHKAVDHKGAAALSRMKRDFRPPNGIDALRKDLPSARLSRPKGLPEEAYAQLTRVQS
ncbi:MAG: hypothetical protein KJZ62_07075 [Fimbriimonadaceae bacterium]|nr:hypothetical protein [Fimbriimonadaceae bacterium]QOJ12616.1 MAG: hypothetical protein HRU74_11350 [Chthonomonadaceae bacterium]